MKNNSDDELAKADAVIGQAFGVVGCQPGRSNEDLAEIARELHNDLGLSLILQWEIADCLLYVSDIFVIKRHRIQGAYLDTYEMIDQVRAICDQKGWKKVVVIAHPHHQWRCVMVAKKLGLETLIVDTSRVHYEKNSSQPWTRSSWRFIPREIAARIIYLFSGKL
ncbi:MAG: hypothetical protein OEV93_03230 [Candidatus Moranbacteria bacterium]|nr:hypothetical protein [Candidatus Moranbacteria bacterium]